MIDPRDPTRLCDLDPLLREAFDHARNEQPSMASVDAVVRGVEQAAFGVGAAQGDALSSLPAKLAVAKSGLVKIAVIIGVSSGLLWAAHSYRAAVTRAAADRTDAPQALPETSVAPHLASPTSRDPEPGVSAPVQPESRGANALAADAKHAAPWPKDGGGTAKPAQSSSRAEASDANATAASSASGALRARAVPRAESAKPESRRRRADEHAQTPAEARAASELVLLEQAQQALRTSPRRALDLTDRHLREYSHGVFVQEREQIAIEALYATGRIAAMRARALAFQRAFPGSAHNARIAELLGTAP